MGLKKLSRLHEKRVVEHEETRFCANWSYQEVLGFFQSVKYCCSVLFGLNVVLKAQNYFASKIEVIRRMKTNQIQH